MARALASAVMALAMYAAFAEAPDRTAQLSFKGVELYSWKDTRSAQWRFSLLQGTNRIKTLAEITNPASAIPDMVALKLRLASLAQGERVYWSVSPQYYSELSFPDPRVVEGLVKFAAERHITVVVER